MKTVEQGSLQCKKSCMLSGMETVPKWICARLALLGRAIHSPENAFYGDFSGPSYLIPLITLGFFSLIISLMQAPVQMDWMQYQLESQSMQPQDIAASLRLLGQTGRFMAAISPLLLLVRFLLIATVLWMWALPAADLLGFPQALNIVAYSYFPLLVRDSASCLILSLRSPEALHTTTGLSVPLGLDLLLHGIPIPWAQLVGRINLFEGWFVLLLVLGIAGVGRISTQKALWVVIPSWMSITAVQAGLAYLGISIQK